MHAGVQDEAVACMLQGKSRSKEKCSRLQRRQESVINRLTFGVTSYASGLGG